MTAYHYTALNQQGKTQKGVIEADSEKLARSQLRSQGLTLTKIQAVKENGKTKLEFSFFKNRLAKSDLTLITRQLATLLSAGLPLEESLLGVAEQSEKVHAKKILLGVRSHVLEGHSFAAALKLFPKAFPEIYSATIAAGEQSGHLDIVLNKLADYIEQQYAVKQKIQQALIYPSLMIMVSISIVTFLLIYVVPKIIGVFTSTNQVLPMPTIFLLAISHFLGSYGIYLFFIIIIAIYFFLRALKTENFKRKFHGFLLKIPFLNFAIKTINTSRYASTLGILTKAGVPILEAMRVSANIVNNLAIRDSVLEAMTRVREGSSIHLSLKQTSYFSPMTLHLIASGEASGQLEAMLERAAKSQEQMMNRLIDTALTLFEPLIILIMGSVVLFIVLAILLPIFSLDQMTG